MRSYTYFNVDESFGVNGGTDCNEVGINMRRPPIIFVVWLGVYSVPNGANVGTAAVA